MKRYEATLSDGSVVRVTMDFNEANGITHVTYEYPAGNLRWPEGGATRSYYGTFAPVGLLRSGGRIERLPHDLIGEVQTHILEDQLYHLVSWKEVGC